MTRFTPRLFFLPLLALVVIGSLPAPAETGHVTGTGCGPDVAQMSDRAIRAEFERMGQRQSATAARICSLYRNSTVGPSR